MEIQDKEAPSFQWSPLDTSVLTAGYSVRGGAAGRPERVGVNRAVPGMPLSAVTDGAWGEGSDGSRRWRLVLRDPGAKALRIHFSRFALPTHGTVTVRGVRGPGDVYRGRGPLHKGSFWAAAVPGDTAVVEYEPGEGGGAEPVIEIDEISHIYQLLGDDVRLDEGAQTASAGGGLLPCHVDVKCQAVDPVARDAVGRLEFTLPGEGTYKCSGALINDLDPNTYAGYMLTARHCINSQAGADSLTVYWFYETDVCGGTVPDPFSLPKTLGAVFLGGTGESDATLLRLLDDPYHGQGIAGWTTETPPDGSIITCIHHPDGSYKRHAAGPVVSVPPFCGDFPISRYLYNDWTPGLGTTEPGSSGSPFFNEDWEIVGQLLGACFDGQPNCTNQSEFNMMGGRFSHTFPFISSTLSTITPDDAFEDNDDIASAAVITPGNHALILVDPVDFWRVTLTESSVISAGVSFDPVDMGVELALVHPNGIVIDSASAVAGSAFVSSDALPGDYLIRLTKAGGWGGSYELDVQTEPADCVSSVAGTPEPGGSFKNRYLSFVPGDNGGEDTAIGVWMMSLNDVSLGGTDVPDYAAFEHTVRFVGEPELVSVPGETPSQYYSALLQCEPYFADWTPFELIHIRGVEVLPSSSYEIAHIKPGCGLANPGNYSSVVAVSTRKWGDVAAPFAPTGVQPTFTDITAIVNAFAERGGALPKTHVQLQPAVPNPQGSITFADINQSVSAFKGLPYPYAGPQPCP